MMMNMKRPEMSFATALFPWYDEVESDALADALEQVEVEREEREDARCKIERDNSVDYDVILSRLAANGDWDTFSDVYKDEYGVRPTLEIFQLYRERA